MTWALIEAFARRGVHVQHFVGRACFPEHGVATSITGLKVRYLDSWLMDEAVCRDLFAHGSQWAELALVEDEFRHGDARGDAVGGDLDTLCEWLDLPRIVVLDASGPAGQIPRRPAQVDAVLLDRVSDQQQLARWTTDVEVVWRVPVLGSLPAGAEFSRRIDRLPPSDAVPADFVRELGDCLERSWRPEAIDQIAQVGAVPPPAKLLRSEAASLRLTVAVAFDEAFNRYFPCSLDMLEARGATVVDFSPLRDEHLPPESDIVLVGGGHPERFASTLADNHCMKTALRNHVRWGRRVYGEGGGAALLCQQLVAHDGESARMAGLLPAVARAGPPTGNPTPVEATLGRPNWLGHSGVQIRGYRNRNWTIEPTAEVGGFFVDHDGHVDMTGTFQVVASLLEIHFGAQASLLNHFFYPHMPVPPDVDPWTHS
jgi:cobyrinic acid a,c-diamide synthase